MYGHHERFSRQELYDLVWSIPASKLCEQFGMSGRGLAKLCLRHEIPVPERGWWARKAAGHDVKELPLLPIKNPYLETIELYVREDFRTYLTADELTTFEKRVADESSIPAPVIPATDASRHPLIVRSRRKHPSSQAEGPLYLEIGVSEPLRDQALRIAAALVEACETRRYDFKPRSDAIGGIATINVLGNRIGVSINEPLLSVPHVLTKTEAREKALGRGWNIPEHDSQPSGQIEIVLDHGISGERRTFSCAQQGGAESALPQVMKALLRLQAEKNYEAERQRRQLEEAEKRRQEEQRRREQQARIAAEKKRRRELLHDAVRFRQAAALMDLISAVEQRAAAQAVDTAACAEWLAYANAVFESLNPVPRVVETLGLRDTNS